MTLPAVLSNIFTNKQKSYKMVLILSLLDEMRSTMRQEVSLIEVISRFLKLLQRRELDGLNVDQPPANIGVRWTETRAEQLSSLIRTPIQALSSVLEFDATRQTLRFIKDIQRGWSDSIENELRNYAMSQIEEYYNRMNETIPLRDYLFKIMQEYLSNKKESFSNNPLGQFVRQTVPQELKKLSFIDDKFKVQGSVGMGNWATIPWISIMDKRITETTQQGEYIVYLFAEDMTSVYLTLAQGVTVPLREKGKSDGYYYLQEKVNELREMLPLEGMFKDQGINLTNGGLGKDYQVSTVAYYRYERERLPSNEQMIADLQNVVENYRLYVENRESTSSSVLENGGTQNISSLEEEVLVDTLSIPNRIEAIKAFISSRGFTYPDKLIENFYLSLKSKPFVILAGVSGTGKTKLVKLFAESLGANSSNRQFTLIPVRPDWSDPTDLLGYKDLSGVFRPGQITEVLVEALKPENQQKPYFICLDEMNLARVEHYFSDMLSILETQEWREGRLVTDPLIKMEYLTTDEDRQMFGDIGLPDNVYLIGTVNMDETTHPFSKKVLDRANTIEFNYIDLGQYPTLGVNSKDHNFTHSHNTFLQANYIQLVDAYSDYRELVEKWTNELVKINAILEEIHSHVGFRIRDTVCFYMIYNERFGLMSQEEAFDMQLLQKILPRIQGSNTSVKRVLLQLAQVTMGKKLNIAELTEDASLLYSGQEITDGERYPRSAKKIAFMLRRLEEDGFTSYWLS